MLRWVAETRFQHPARPTSPRPAVSALCIKCRLSPTLSQLTTSEAKWPAPQHHSPADVENSFISSPHFYDPNLCLYKNTLQYICGGWMPLTQEFATGEVRGPLPASLAWVPAVQRWAHSQFFFSQPLTRAASDTVSLSNVNRAGLIFLRWWGPDRSDDLLLECHLQVWLNYSPWLNWYLQLMYLPPEAEEKSTALPSHALRRSFVGGLQIFSIGFEKVTLQIIAFFVVVQICFSWYHFSSNRLTISVRLYLKRPFIYVIS